VIGGPRAAGDPDAGLLRWASLSLLVHGVLALASLDWTWAPRPASDWASSRSSPVEVRVVAPPAPPQPRSSPENTAPTPQPQLPTPTEPEPAETKPAPAVEPPPTASSAPAPEAAPEPESTIAAAPPPETERPVEPVPDARPEPKQNASTEASAEEPTEAAAEPVEVAALDPSEVSAPPPAPSGPSAAEVDAYIAEVRRRIEERKAYPALARRRGLESRVTVRISIGADGQLSGVETLDSTVALFERAAVQAIEDAAPFPPPPPGFGELEIPLRYTME